jgi:dTDP-L-rhamnose 4-epimerase
VTGQYRLGDVRHITADSARIRAELEWMPRIEFAEGMLQLARGDDVTAGRKLFDVG